MSTEDTANHILIDLDAESQRDLLGNGKDTKEAKKGPSPGKPVARPAPQAPRDPEFDQRIEEDPFA